MRSLTVAGILLVIGLLVVSQGVFSVRENQRGVVLRLGDPKDGVYAPGLHFKMPIADTVLYFDQRVMSFDIPKNRAFSADQKELDLDSYVCWRIVDPIRFVRTLRTESAATVRLTSIVDAKLKAAIGSATLTEIVNTKRKLIMETVLRKSQEETVPFGVEIVDVRIKRADLPNRQAIFDRMRADRKKRANQYRAEGESASREIRSQAEKTRDVILAQAQRNSTIIKGEADARAMEIFSVAISQSPEFYEFIKSLDVYRAAFKDNAKFILSTDDSLLQLFQ